MTEKLAHTAIVNLRGRASEFDAQTYQTAFCLGKGTTGYPDYAQDDCEGEASVQEIICHGKRKAGSVRGRPQPTATKRAKMMGRMKTRGLFLEEIPQQSLREIFEAAN